ncbi:MAG: hypothetical protein ACQEUT_15980 [Bacillota bacterium]
MKKISLLLFFVLLSVALIGCQPQAELERLEKITIYKMEEASLKLVFQEPDTIEMITEAINKAEKQSGIVNMADPQFKIVLGKEKYFLWISEKSGTIMNAEDTHTIYSLPQHSIKQVNELLN